MTIHIGVREPADLAADVEDSSDALTSCVLLVSMDFALTFVTPALAYTTRSAVRALRIGLAMILQTWPRCAFYVLCPPLAVNILSVVYPVSIPGARLVLDVVLALAWLLAKGAIAAFYLRERGSFSDDGALSTSTRPDVLRGTTTPGSPSAWWRSSAAPWWWSPGVRRWWWAARWWRWRR